MSENTRSASALLTGKLSNLTTKPASFSKGHTPSLFFRRFTDAQNASALVFSGHSNRNSRNHSDSNSSQSAAEMDGKKLPSIERMLGLAAA